MPRTRRRAKPGGRSDRRRSYRQRGLPPWPGAARLRYVGLREIVYSVYERRLQHALAGRPVPRHVAVMVDGNRRWARAAGFEDVSEGHLAGALRIADLLEWCDEVGVEHVTIW